MGNIRVLGFYGHAPSQKYRGFSNFFKAPFLFVVPEELCAFQMSLQDRTVQCEYSEKAIMLCKAAAMGDECNYYKIASFNGKPSLIKAMGRRVRGFDESLWQDVVCSVAYEVVFQKFSNSESLKEQLLATGDLVIAEATINDRLWGIGLNGDDPKVHEPKHWLGANVLGWALMQTREALRR